MSLRIGAAHYAPVLLDRAATLEKVVSIIAEAGAAGVRLLGFPETFVPGYPYWLAIQAFDEQGEINRRYAEESVELASEDLVPVARACGRHRVNVVLGISERYGGTSSTPRCSSTTRENWLGPTGSCSRRRSSVHYGDKATGRPPRLRPRRGEGRRSDLW